jgi:hypothetical protein
MIRLQSNSYVIAQLAACWGRPLSQQAALAAHAHEPMAVQAERWLAGRRVAARTHVIDVFGIQTLKKEKKRTRCHGVN